jgi:hypothetical protein
MTESHTCLYTTFDGQRRIANGSLQANALAARKALAGQSAGPVLVFDDQTGRPAEVDTRGSDEEVAARYPNTATPEVAPVAQDDVPGPAGPRSRGRPRLGVVPREVTLLPRHWEWLGSQPGGASVALRKLVEEARRAGAAKDRLRQAQERAYRFMQAIGGDLPGFEEATRALFANDPIRFNELLAAWPHDVREHAIRLAG